MSAADWRTATEVRGLRARGVSWGNIAKMLDRSEHDVRLAFDATYEPPGMLLRPVPTAGEGAPADSLIVAEAKGRARQAKRKPRPQVEAGSQEAVALRCIADAFPFATPAMVAEAIKRDGTHARCIAYSLRRKGLTQTTAVKPVEWTATALGLEILAELEGVALVLPEGMTLPEAD